MRVAIGLGANLQDPGSAIRRALGGLAAGGVAALECAPLYVTRPVDCETGTPDFLNTVACGWWRGSPLALLSLCRRLERHLGRPSAHSPRQARTIDLDLLLVGERWLDSAFLTVPHPRLSGRLFVLVPLADLAPEWRVPPTLETVAALRDRALCHPGAASWGRRVQD